MAVVWALEKFRSYLIGLNFKVVTDCNAVRATMSKRTLLPRIGRWWLRLQEFTFDVEYRKGTTMAHVDALSRSPHDPPEETDVVGGIQILATCVEVEDCLASRKLTIPK